MADHMTITGSIGSINGKFNMKGLYDKLGITWDTQEIGPMALLDSDLRDYTPEEKARMEEDHWAGFNAWLQDVSEHRGMTFEEAEKLAHGRVWTGRQALDNGLIDELGDMARAIEVAMELAEIPAGEKVTVEHFPKKVGMLQAILGGDDAASAAANWLIYRSVREKAVETMEILATRPELAN
jgi:protease-4